MGEFGGGEEKGTDVVLLAETQLRFGTGEAGLVADVVDDIPVGTESGFQFRKGQIEDILVGVEVDEAPDGGVAESGGEGEG